MKLELSADQRAMVGTVRDLVRDKFHHRVPKWQDGTFPHENLKDLAEIGVLGMAVPEEYGGLGLPVLDCVLVLEEVAKVCYVTSMAAMSAMGAQNRIISVYAPEEVRILRAVRRDASSRELIEKRIRSQMNDEEKRKYADFVIVNDGETPLIPQVLELIGSLSEKMHYLLRK